MNKNRQTLLTYGLIFCALILLFWVALPSVSKLENENPEITKFMELYLEEAEAQNETVSLSHSYKSYENISNHLKRAVLILEDDTFTDHTGFNWKEINNAIKINFEKGKLLRGASTITQQLAKNLYLSPEKSVFRKMIETWLTFQMENQLTKKRILELYLNYAEWGYGIFGAEAASRYYFGKSAQNLSSYEASFLAAILPNPKFFGKRKNSRLIQRKMNTALQRLHTQKIP